MDVLVIYLLLLGSSSSFLLLWMSPLNAFPLPCSTMLSFVSRGHWRDTVGRKFLFVALVCSCSRLLPALSMVSPASGSRYLCSSSKAWPPALHSGQQYPAAPPVSHIPMISFPWYPEELISIKFSLHVTAVTSLPFGKPRPCSLQQGQDLSLGLEHSSWEALPRVQGVLAAPYIY